jgi:4-amino-4-deoxy-L-arabinose transferase-like glycosyltransferase
VRQSDSKEQRKPLALILAVAATLAMGLWMARSTPLAFGPLWGTLIALVAAAAWARWLVPPSEQVRIDWRQTGLGRELGERWSPLGWAALALAVLISGCAIGGYAWLPLTIVLALACLTPAAVRRPGLAVMLAIGVMYLPTLGTTGLWDPWETHYAEVAREILARNDWISLWWAQDHWFWSKPVLPFWMEAWAMGVLGVEFMPDAHPSHPEWAIRLPTMWTALAALGAIYATVRRFFGPRAGALATLVTATMPQFFFISRQAMTDLPLVAAITIAMCCLLMATQQDPDRQAPALSIGPWRISSAQLVLFLLFALALPQAMYLISRNITWLDGAGLVPHPDRFLFGSAGNPDVPGNPAPREEAPRIRGLLAEPFVQGLLWLAMLGLIAAVLRKERRSRALWMAGFYLACAIAFLSKGLPGLALPGAAALFYLIASRRWSLLASGELRIWTGMLLVAVVSLPWFVATYVRHGSAFLNRLLIHDHINRLASGVHGDKGTIAYFVAQTGYATFPWVGLVPAACVVAFSIHAGAPRDARGQAVLMLLMWLASSFALFSAMVTKFHHYILPALVPLGILIGVAMAQWWGGKHARPTWLSAAAGACLVVGFAWLAGDPRGVIPADAMQVQDWVLQQARPLEACGLLALGVLLAALARWDLARRQTRPMPGPPGAALGASLLAGACLVAFVGRDLSWVTSARPQGYERLIHLFVYNYERPWPEHLDYRPILTGFAAAAALTVAAASIRAWRAVAARALAGVAVLLCLWGVNVYMTDLAPHWGIRELVARYYAERSSSEEPLVAWQMNWKGENFYTGNRVYVFAETDNKRIGKWLAAHKGKRAFVVLEHKRLARLRELVPGRPIRELSTKRDNNKLLLVTLEIGGPGRVESPGL